jgi:hypothetical protein
LAELYTKEVSNTVAATATQRAWQLNQSITSAGLLVHELCNLGGHQPWGQQWQFSFTFKHSSGASGLERVMLSEW